MRDWRDEDGMTEEQVCSDCFLGGLELDLSTPFKSNVVDIGWSASDVLGLISECDQKGYQQFNPTSTALNITTQTTIEPIAICEPSAIYTIQPEDTCHGLCLAHNVSTYSLTASNGLNLYCGGLPPTGTVICLPESCDVYTVQENDEIEEIAGHQPGNVSVAQLLAWNPHLIPLWNLKAQTGMQICVSPPTSTRDLANATDTQCARYYTIQPGDTCTGILAREGISLSSLYYLNRDVETDIAKLVPGERYCVRVVPVENAEMSSSSTAVAGSTEAGSSGGVETATTV
jgi:LysM repeat protein